MTALSNICAYDYVSEMLSYNLPIFGRSRASRWLAERGLEDLDGLWMDEISGEMNVELMAALAQHSPSDLLVLILLPSPEPHVHVASVPGGACRR